MKKTKKVDPERLARLWVDPHGRYPVWIITGDQPPAMTGNSGYWTTPGGREIKNPNSYGHPTVYHRSTRRVEVGRRWLHRHQAVEIQSRDGSRTVIIPSSRNRIHGYSVVQGWVHMGGPGWRPCAYVTQGRWDYHGDRGRGPRDAVRRAVAARRRQQQQLDGLPVAAVWVSIEDSLRGGNCRAATEAYAERVWQHIGARGPCGVRSDVLLELRNDEFTRRAVAAAVARVS